MLSVVDLLNAGTVTPRFLAYMVQALEKGVSFLVGARPGAAGKTTVMAALLGLVPGGELLQSIAGPGDLPNPQDSTDILSRKTLICHEIGRGRWYGYLWGSPVRHYLNLASQGYRIASNLHADSLPEIIDQLEPFGIDEVFLASHVRVLIFLKVFDEPRRGKRIFRVWSVEESMIPNTGEPHYETIFKHPDSEPHGSLQQVSASEIVPDISLNARHESIFNDFMGIQNPTWGTVRDHFLASKLVKNQEN